MVIDTGSSWLTVPVSGCQGCSNATYTPDSADLTTSVSESITYGPGLVQGTQLITSCLIESMAIPSIRTIGVSLVEALENSAMDGIMGLAP